MDKFAALILAKGHSTRLRGKNMKDFSGQPMFMVNVMKCLGGFSKVYVSSDDHTILNIARMAGANPIWRDQDLCGDVPNIPVYQHALKEMGDVEGIVAVQACSPTISPQLIQTAKQLLFDGYQEVMTVHPIKKNDNYHQQSFDIYGSIWALSRKRLEAYGDPFKPNPDALLVDPSIDIHDYQDYKAALRQWQS